ncbi:MAG: TonB-dependent receptor [bacterium]
MINKFYTPLFLLFLFILTCSVYGQDETSASELAELSLEDLLNVEVTTASKKAEKTTDAPGIISTITAEEIKYFGATSITEILQRATSIQPFVSHLFGTSATGFRGDLRTLYNNHVLLLINGKPIREGVSGGIDYAIFAGFPVEMISKIEIVRGPGSVLYGSNAFVGVINIITKDNDESSSLGAKITAGSFGTTIGTVTGKYVNDDFNAKVSAKIGNITGWDYNAITAKPASDNLPVEMKAGQKNLGVAADASYKGFSFLGFYTNDTENILGILPYATYKGKNKVSRLILNLGYTYNFDDNWEASLNLSHSGTELTINDEALIPKDHHKSTDYLGELTINGQILENLNIIFGGVLDSRNKNDIQDKDAIKEPYNITQVSGYLQADYRPIDELKFILGAQYNKPEGKDADVVPRFGAIFNVTGEFGIKALYGAAFRSPWPLEMFLQNPAVKGNPNLSPEKIATIDVQAFYSAKSLELSLTYYNSKYTNSITRVPVAGQTGVVTYANAGDLNTYGIEFEGKGTVASNIFITGSATYQKNADEDKVMLYVPNFMGKIGAFFSPFQDFTVGIFNTFFGAPKENMGAKVNPEAKSVDLLSLNFVYQLPIEFPIELNLNVQNLLDADYYYTEMSRGWVNTLPNGPGIAVYGGIGLKL